MNVLRNTQLVKKYALSLGFDMVGITDAENFNDEQSITLGRIENGLMDGLPWYTQDRVIRGCNRD